MGNSFASPKGIINISLAGVFFGMLRILTGGMVFGWSVSDHASLPSVFRCLGEPPWGAFDPEESVLMTVGLLGRIAVYYLFCV